MKIVTYNIQFGSGKDGRIDLADDAGLYGRYRWKVPCIGSVDVRLEASALER